MEEEGGGSFLTRYLDPQLTPQSGHLLHWFLELLPLHRDPRALAATALLLSTASHSLSRSLSHCQSFSLSSPASSSISTSTTSLLAHCICIYSQGCPVDGVGLTTDSARAKYTSYNAAAARTRSGRGDMVLGKQQQNVQRKEGDKGR